jgi:BolA family transcriptional regulator, general stress-responsive regulator
MSTAEVMKERLARLDPVSLEIVDESSRHAGHEGAKSGGGHYRLTIVSGQFAGQPVQARHRMVYDALGALMRKEIHALAIKASTPEELTRKECQ